MKHTECENWLYFVFHLLVNWLNDPADKADKVALTNSVI
jgi:hypothetical protein